MTSKHSHAVRLAANTKSTIKSKVRAQFNALVGKLEGERKRLAAWHDAMPKLRARAEADLMPLVDRFGARQRALILLFDAAYKGNKLTRTEREKVSDLICNLSLELIDGGEDKELLEIYERHSGVGELADDPDFISLSDMIDQMMNDVIAKQGQPSVLFGNDTGGGAVKGSKKSATRKASVAAARQAAEENRLAQSVRDIFRKLASDLHPDREADPAERERKTQLMQRANVAYAANDLLGLLELQFEVEQIDASKLDTLGEVRIKQYNKVLAKQVDEVRREIDELEHWLVYALNIEAQGRMTPARMDKALSAAINTFWVKVAGIEKDLEDLKDIKVMKTFLKKYRIRDPFDFMDDEYY